MFQTLGIIGSGRIGTAVARVAVAAGLDVVLSNSRGPDTLAGLVAELGAEHARAGTPEEAARAGDLVVAAIPFIAYRQLPVAALAGKTVLDTANYYPERDGHLDELDSGVLTSSELIQRHVPDARLVKAFNTITPHQIVSLARAAGTLGRSALPVASDHADATAETTRFLDLLGWDAVDIGPLSESWRSEPNTPVYIRPYLGEIPALGLDDFLEWTEGVPGIAVPAAEIARLVKDAVRQTAGAARLPSDA
ncbi:NADPH-dependent F420 reductase [Actinomadura rupiterrae]|uniref:NADPH-dependent F420 reductase n=1 Tax=Actinomadura rupiterrae TaxID=559627 RepID=UPI0020A330C2|nr:NAD(P)-binding domain-containing protein [Actinomadura rupiterrae]MCP2340453.1 hypothetical protein [Actinomadura rupiterrae]